MEALAVRTLGDAPPRIVLLHGMFNSGRYWGQPYDGLSTLGSMVVPDLLGFGRSPQPESGYTSDGHADAVADTIRACGATEPVVVGAHSVGSLVAIALAARHPDLVSSVVAFAPPLYPDGAAARRQLAEIDPLARLSLANEALSRRLCDLRSRYVKTSACLVRLANPTLPAPLAQDRVRHSWQSYSETLSNLIVSAEVSDELTKLAIPVRLVVGQRDKAVDLPFLAELATGCSHLSLGIVGDGGHDLPLTHPEVCIAELKAAIQREPPDIGTADATGCDGPLT
jgi:pimeloyl-ACP methyl ester carboxylesterase